MVRTLHHFLTEAFRPSAESGRGERSADAPRPQTPKPSKPSPDLRLLDLLLRVRLRHLRDFADPLRHARVGRLHLRRSFSSTAGKTERISASTVQLERPNGRQGGASEHPRAVTGSRLRQISALLYDPDATWRAHRRITE